MLDVPQPYDVRPQVAGVVVAKMKTVDSWDDPRSLRTFQTFPRPYLPQAPADGSRRPSSLPNTSSSSSSDESTDGATEEDVEDEEAFPPPLMVRMCLGAQDRRFGFSVIGGKDEGFPPRIDTITPGSPADRADLEVGDEILEVNGRSLENCTHTEVIAHIHQCIRSRTICLRVKRKTGSKLALDLASNSNVQDAFVIAVEQQARERLEKLSALKKIQPVDMTQLSQELLQVEPELSTDFTVAQLNTSANSHYQPNGHHPNGSPNGTAVVNPIYVTSVPDIQNATLEREKRIKQLNNNNEEHLQNAESDLEHPTTPDECQAPDQELELTQEITDEDLTPSHRSVCLESLSSSVERHPIDSANCRKVEVSVHRARDDTPSDLETPMESVVMVAPASHREMAVDVPDSFVAVSKTPPRYPPPSKTNGKKSGRNGTVVVSLHEPSVRTLTKPGEPDIKPKVHVNGRTTSTVNSAVVASKPANGTAVSVDANRNIKDEQVERIRKHQEDIRKRKEEEDRLAKEEEFLRSSLRGSKKLQALESSPPQSRSGVVNTAFQLEDGDPGNTSTLPLTRESHASTTATARLLVGDVVDNGIELPELKKIVGASELLQSLQRIENHLRGLESSESSSSTAVEPSSVSSELVYVEKLFKNVEFRKLLAVHNKVQEIWCFKCPPNPVCDEAEDLAQDVMNSLQECSLPEATELLDLLSKYEFEGLLYSHDKIAERQVVPAMTPDEELLDRASQYTEESVKIVRIDKTNEPLGATVRNEGEAVVIGRIVKGGAAEKSGLLHEGDEILEVNGIEMRGKSVNEVCDILATMTGTLTFLIIPSQFDKPKVPSKENMMHVKAHFDYDPDDDLYIPCRELGISFQKGDILHVINQDDPNWWQAFREGEEDQTLAGLIPSKCFQQQREAMKQTIVGDADNTKSKKGKFLCAKKHHKKKKKKLLYNANSEIDLEQILTYEEVAMYYPRANKKRPIVLIGPPNIGRHELRQRLMENTDRFAAAIPHTSRLRRDGSSKRRREGSGKRKRDGANSPQLDAEYYDTSRPRRDGENDGVDYHFITRTQFEADILGGRFVEHGEYEKNYYGTSLDAIRSVVNSGKICVLNLHPQSLKILKNSDLKPYIVLVAPPSLEKLRVNRIKAGASAKDEELKEIIEKAREMEETFGHFFDMIIINSDIDKAYAELLKEINILEREPQWVPASWLVNEGN